VFKGRDFVGWYNGDPDLSKLQPDLSGDTAVIIGQGNVALDCARILLSPISALQTTDISTHALETLKTSKIRNVHIIGRRGVLQASFTSKEIREMMNLPDVSFSHDDSMVSAIQTSSDYLSNNRVKMRLMDLLAKNSSKVSSALKMWSLGFLSSPTRILSEKKKMVALELERNVLEEKVKGNPESASVVPTGEKFVLKASLLIKCIGYLNSPIANAPFDTGKGIIPNKLGRVLNSDQNPVEGLYVTGWIKTGPVGVLTSTLFDANETASSIIQDLKAVHIDERPGLILYINSRT
jgi:adrenodoxin-NADP+ reductase